MDRYGNQPFPFREGFVEHAGGGGPADLLWVIFGIALALLLIAIVSVALDAYYRLQGQRPFVKWLGPGMAPGGRALALLDVRYARGELSRKDYLRAREDIRGAPDDLDETTEVIPPPDPGRRGRKKDTT